MARVAHAQREAYFEAQRGKILEAAMRLFAANGFDATTVDEIAREAGMAKGSVYLYFPAKSALLDSLIHRYVLVPDLPQLIDSVRKLPVSCGVATLVREIWTRLKERQEPARMLIREIQTHPKRARVFTEQVTVRANELLASYLEAGIRNGELRGINPVVAAQCLFGMLWVFMLTQEMMGGAELQPLSDDEIVSAVSGIFLDGTAVAKDLDGKNT